MRPVVMFLCAALLTCCGGITPSGDSSPGPMSSAPVNPNTPKSPVAGPPAVSASPNDLLTQVDFEDGSTGDWNRVAANGNAQVVTTQAAHGTHALQLVAGPNYNDAAFLVNTKLFPLAPNQLYVRFYMNLAAPLPDGHTTFAVASGSDPSSEVRAGGQFSILVDNIASTDGERISADNYNGFPNGVKLTPATWYCMELQFDGQAQAMHTWLNGKEITNLAVTQPSDWNSPPGATWIPALTQLKLGWQSYGAGTGNTVLLDDVAVSHTPIGCL